MKNILFAIGFALLLFACKQSITKTRIVGNPPTAGFDTANSDAKAIAIADQVVEAVGGRQNWEDTRLIKWNFFGSRKLAWDKQTGDVRIDYLKEDLAILLNIHTMEGKAMRNDTLFTKGHPEHNSLMEKGNSVWINDAYWLVLPFKLKDTGVTLKYMGTDNSQAGESSEVLQLTYKNVGRTPDNKYLVYVDQQTNLINQWDYYPNYTDTIPRFQIPWKDYRQHGAILLSGDRGKNQLTEIEVGSEIPKGLFTDF